MRVFLWVWWCWGSHIWCMTLYFHVDMLCSSKSNKLMCEKLAFSCHWITSFHEFGFNLEGVLYHIYIRVLLWVWWFCGIHILCITLYFSVHILCSSKSKKLMCENLVFSCHWITNFHDFGFNLEGVLYQICMRDFIWVLWLC